MFFGASSSRALGTYPTLVGDRHCRIEMNAEINTLQEQLLMCTFYTCVMSYNSKFTCNACRKWTRKAIVKVESHALLPWASIDEKCSTVPLSPQKDGTKSVPANTKYVNQMKFDQASGGGDFFKFFRWVLLGTDAREAATQIQQQIYIMHPTFASHEAAITMARTCSDPMPFPSDRAAARKWTSRALKNARYTRSGKKFRFVVVATIYA